MLKRWISSFVVAALSSAAVPAMQSQTAPQPNWVGTWAAAPMAAEGWAMRVLSGNTLREVVHISAGGPQVRLRFTNQFGTDVLTISDAHVALSAGGGATQPGTDHAVTFGGANTVNVPPGGAIYSDAVAFEVAPMADLAVSFYVPPQVMRNETYHALAVQDNYIATGDAAAQEQLPQHTTVNSWYLFDGVDVAAAPGARAIVTLGDSITDGALATENMNRRWPDFLAARLQADPKLKNVSVLNVGISGNRVLNEGAGPSAVSRIDRDILAQNGVKYVIILESINDIGRLAARMLPPADDITAEQLEWGFKQIVDAAHLHGIKVYGATLTPYGGAGYASEKGEQVREALNTWIRTSGTLDGVIDFDKTTQDPQNPTKFNAEYDSGDHLHPKDAGYKAMGESIDLSLFAK